MINWVHLVGFQDIDLLWCETNFKCLVKLYCEGWGSLSVNKEKYINELKILSLLVFQKYPGTKTLLEMLYRVLRKECSTRKVDAPVLNAINLRSTSIITPYRKKKQYGIQNLMPIGLRGTMESMFSGRVIRTVALHTLQNIPNSQPNRRQRKLQWWNVTKIWQRCQSLDSPA